MDSLLSSDPSRIGDYRLLARIGGGAMGSVYLARSRGGREVAIKVVRPDLAEDPQFRERFRREVQASAAVGGFWTAAVVDADPDGERPWLATEYVPGPTLHQAVADSGGLPEHAVRGLAAGLAEALQAVHGAGLVHRDLKPANVLLGPDGPRVIDFGISRALTASSMTATGMLFGTPGYFSPEQTLGTEVGPPSDVFSLGAVLVFAATGGGPFGNDHTTAMLYRVTHSEPDLGGVPEELRPLVASCLAKDPTARPTPGALLDWIGDTGPEGNRWLPPTVTALIGRHTAMLEQAVEPQPSEPRPSGSRSSEPHAAPRGDTLVDPAMAPARNGAEHEEAGPYGRVASPSAPSERGDRAVRAGQPGTTPRAAPSADPQVHKGGAVFRTGGRVSSLLSAAFVLVLVCVVEYLAQTTTMAGSARLVLVFLVLSGLLLLFRAVVPGLRIDINAAGLRVSRMGLHQEIPWERVHRVGVVGRGKRQAVAVWVHDPATLPRSTWWHRVRSYHDGARVFPIGTTGGWWTRRQEVRRLRNALVQYGRATYDNNLL